MKKRVIATIGATMISATLLLSSCVSPYNDINNDISMIGTSYKEYVRDTLYYIPHEVGTADFPIKLKAFLESNPHLELVGTQETALEGSYNAVSGYLIYTQRK